MRRVQGFMGASAGTVARQLAALGAIAHFDPSWGATDDGTTSTWIDRIGGTVCQSTSQATRLQYSGSIAGLNNRPGWNGVAANATKLVSTTATLAELIDGVVPYTLYCVRKATDVTAFNMVCSAGSTTLAQYIYHSAGPVSGANFVTRRDGVGQTQSGGAVNALTAAAVDSAVFSGTAESLWSNGSRSLSAGVNTRSPTCDRFVIGALLSGGVYSLSFWGAIGDIVIFAAAHTAAQRRQIEQLLAIKYGWPVLQGVADLSIANYFATAAGAGVRGANGVGVWMDALIRPDAVPAAFQVITQAITTGTFGGWSIDSASGGAAFAPRAGQGASVVIGPTRTIAAADVGKLMLFGGTVDGALVRTFVNGAEVGAGSALVGYAAAAGTKAQTVGQDSGTGGAASFSMFGTAGGNVAQTAANQAARAAAIKAAGRYIATGGATPTHGWAIDGTDATFSDLVGSDVLTRQGTLTAAQIIITEWPW
jgi:hypothetical protein